MLCLEREEFEKIYKEQRQKELVEFISQEGISLDDLASSKKKLEEVATTLHDRLMEQKEEIEIFAAAFVYLRVYDNSQVCFILRDNIDPRKNPPKTLEELKSSIKENSIVDFGILSEDGLREFQLKQYKEKLTTDDLSNFIQKVVNKYGKDFGNTNLMIVLQSGGDIGDLDFEELNQRVTNMGIKSDCEVLISYNENNKFNVINCVYPNLATNRREIIPITI